MAKAIVKLCPEPKPTEKIYEIRLEQLGVGGGVRLNAYIENRLQYAILDIKPNASGKLSILRHGYINDAESFSLDDSERIRDF